MSVADSEPVFRSRALACGFSAEEYDKFKHEGLGTMAMFAFSCNFSPGAADDKPLMELGQKVIGQPLSIKQAAGMRRLFAECYSAVASDIKAQIESTDDGSVRKLPAADRAQRLKDQQARITGFAIRGPYEPGDSLIDKACQMHEQDRLLYLEWSSCVSREHELTTNTKKDQGLTFDSGGILRLSKKDRVTPCDVSSELPIRYSLIRRGLALDQAGILTYSHHESLVEKLFQARLTPPPAGYAKVSLGQMQQADQKFFLLMSENTRDGIRLANGGRPCDLAFTKCFESTEFLTLLQPRPYAVSGSSSADASEAPNKKRKWAPEQSAKSHGKGKDKAGNSDFARVPRALLALNCVGMHPKTKARFCYNWNLKKCEHGGKECSRGLHVCAVRNCHSADHAAMDCPKRKQS